MLHKIKEIEESLKLNSSISDETLNKCNIYELMTEQENEKKIWETNDREEKDDESCYQFIEKDYHMELLDILLDACFCNVEFEQAVELVTEKSEELNISIRKDEIQKYICKTIIYGLIDVSSTQKIQIKDTYNTSFDMDALERMYLVECLLIEILEKKRAPHDGKAICLETKQIHLEHYDRLLKKRTLRNLRRIQELERYKEKCETIQDLQKFSEEQITIISQKGAEEQQKISEAVNESVKENTKELYKNNMEIIGIFLAVFSIIGFNLFRNADIGIITVLLLTVSCIMSLVIMFLLIEHIINKKIQAWQYLLAIVILAILLYKLVQLEV